VLSQRATRVVNSVELKKTIDENDVKLAIEDMIKKRTVKSNMTKVFRENPPFQAAPTSYAPPPSETKQKTEEKIEVANEVESFQSPPETKQKTEEKIEVANEVESFQSPTEPVVCSSSEQRDAGVSDQIWEELEMAKKKHQEKMDRIRDENERKEQERQAKALEERIRQICPCPAGFAWYKVGGGWRCGGGSHYVTDAQLNAQFTC